MSVMDQWLKTGTVKKPKFDVDHNSSPNTSQHVSAAASTPTPGTVKRHMPQVLHTRKENTVKSTLNMGFH